MNRAHSRQVAPSSRRVARICPMQEVVMTRIKALLLCVCTILAPLGEATAQTYPTRPLTLVVPYSPGTGLDTVARAISTAVSPKLGQPIVVENRPGAGTNIGVGYAARAKP